MEAQKSFFPRKSLSKRRCKPTHEVNLNKRVSVWIFKLAKYEKSMALTKHLQKFFVKTILEKWELETVRTAISSRKSDTFGPK